MVNDFIGQELKVGDYVAFIRPQYRQLLLGRITKFTPNFVEVMYQLTDNTKDTHRTDPVNVVKLNGIDALALILKSNL